MPRITKRSFDSKSFKADIDAEEFAGTIENLPDIADLTRSAVLADGEKLAAVRAAAAGRAALRAKAVGRVEEAARAEREVTRSKTIGAVLRSERIRVAREEDAVGRPDPGAAEFRVQGKIVTASGKPAGGLTVDLVAEKGDARFSAKTDDAGIFAVDIPVGVGPNEIAEGDDLGYVVRSGRSVLAKSGKDVPVVKGGDAARIRVILPGTGRTPRPVRPTRPTPGDPTPSRPARPTKPEGNARRTRRRKK